MWTFFVTRSYLILSRTVRDGHIQVSANPRRKPLRLLLLLLNDPPRLPIAVSAAGHYLLSYLFLLYTVLSNCAGHATFLCMKASAPPSRHARNQPLAGFRAGSTHPSALLRRTAVGRFLGTQLILPPEWPSCLVPFRRVRVYLYVALLVSKSALSCIR